MKVYNNMIPFTAFKEGIFALSRPVMEGKDNSNRQGLLEYCRICDVLFNEKSAQNKKYCEFCG